MKQYKELVRSTLDHGQLRGDRTGTGTRSIFGTQHRYDLAAGFPLCTTKKVYFKAVVAELLWFLSGSTNINDLDAKIWDEWASEDGELGPIYGHQWRNWGSNWRDPDMEDGDGKLHYANSIDQIQQAIDTIKNNPESRRNIVSAWNPTDVPAMALPPCHLMFQFYVRPGKVRVMEGFTRTDKGHLDCQMYQRSADVALGVPFNIASYALLTHLVANECGLLPGVFVHTIGDAHAYVNHIEGLELQMTRVPKPLPLLKLPEGKPVDEITADDIQLIGYEFHPTIKFKVSV